MTVIDLAGWVGSAGAVVIAAALLWLVSGRPRTLRRPDPASVRTDAADLSWIPDPVLPVHVPRGAGRHRADTTMIPVVSEPAA